MIFLRQTLTFLGLIPTIRILFRIQIVGPFHIRDLIFRAQYFFRIAMAFQTPFHVQRIDVVHQRHQVNATMTGRTTDAFIDVNAVVEIGEIGKVMHFRPFKRFVISPACAHDFQVGRIAE